ncbi:MAG: hypothetical protein V2A53_07275 [bacterium]
MKNLIGKEPDYIISTCLDWEDNEESLCLSLSWSYGELLSGTLNST